VDVNTTVIANLRNQLRSLPWYYWQGPFNAAKYCHDNDVNLDEALKWAEQSIRNQENFNNVNLKSQLLTKLGKTEEAAKVHAHAQKIATEQDLTNYAYSFALTDKAKCLKILNDNLKRFKSWKSYRAIAAYYRYFQEKENAIKYFKLALQKAPADQKENLEKAIKGLQG
jgi:tetratricopeptide (TPR) repeat protein